MVCFYCTQSDILLCGIARFSRANKNKLRTFQPQKWKKLRRARLKQNLLVLIKKKSVNRFLTVEAVLEKGVAEKCSVKKSS